MLQKDGTVNGEEEEQVNCYFPQMPIASTHITNKQGYWAKTKSQEGAQPTTLPFSAGNPKLDYYM